MGKYQLTRNAAGSVTDCQYSALAQHPEVTCMYAYVMGWR